MNEENFSSTQLSYLRMALKEYRDFQGMNWLEVAEKIIYSKTNNFNFPDDEDKEIELDMVYRLSEKEERRRKNDVGWPIQEQDLRRFADGVRNKKTGINVKSVSSPPKRVALRDFLKNKKFLPENYFEIEKDELTYLAISNMLKFFCIPQKYLLSNDIPDLTGDYESNQDNIAEKYNRTIKAFPSPQENFYRIEEKTIYFKPSTTLKTKKENLAGMAFFPESTTLIGFLRDVIDKTENCDTKIYIFRDIECENNIISSIRIDNVSNSLSFSEENEDVNNPYKSLIFKRYPNLSGQRSKKYDKVVNILGKRKPDISTFSNDKVATHPWQQYQKKLKEKGLIQEKDDALTQDEINKAFIDAARDGKFWLFDEYISKGADVNFQLEGSKMSALHFAAKYDAVPAMHELIKNKDLKHLTLDSQGHLPSFYAHMVADNNGVTTFLIKKEAQEAKSLGLSFHDVHPNMPTPT